MRTIINVITGSKLNFANARKSQKCFGKQGPGDRFDLWRKRRVWVRPDNCAKRRAAPPASSFRAAFPSADSLIHDAQSQSLKRFQLYHPSTSQHAVSCWADPYGPKSSESDGNEMINKLRKPKEFDILIAAR
jgi:hypothetical protein